MGILGDFFGSFFDLDGDGSMDMGEELMAMSFLDNLNDQESMETDQRLLDNLENLK